MSTNRDFRGNLRGPCKSSECDCDQYFYTDGNMCGMCSCFPGKHALLSELSSEVEAAVAQLTPSKTLEIDMDTGKLTVHSDNSKENVTKKLNLENGNDSSSTVNGIECKDIVMETSSVEKASNPNVNGHTFEDNSFDSDDANKDPNYVPDIDNIHMDTDEAGTADDSVTTSRKNYKGKSKHPVQSFSTRSIKPDFLSVDLQEKIGKRGLFQCEDAFVSEAASYLVSLAQSSKPTAAEQDLFCSKGVEYFPELKTSIGKVPWAGFKTTVSRHLVQRRYREKHTKPAKTSKYTSCSIVPLEIEENEQSLEEMLSKLKDINKTSADAEVRHLIRETCTARRVTLATEDNTKSPSEVAKIWPHLLVPDWIIYDFYSFKEINAAEFETNVDTFLRKLAKMFDKEENEKGFTESLLTMAKKLNKQFKTVHGVVSSIELLVSLEKLKPKPTESPRLVLCMGASTLQQCYLIFDDTRLELETPTVRRAVILLMAAYYVFDIQYPDAFANFLRVLDCECAKKTEEVKSSQRTVFKFIREFSTIIL